MTYAENNLILYLTYLIYNIKCIKDIRNTRMLVDEIRKQYKEAEPIFVNDLKTDDISRPALTQQLGTLCRNHVIEKFDNGIYYIPKKSRLQNSVGPSADTIARYKYVTDGKTVKGFYSGYTFANQLGITTQVPARVEIVSNNTSAIVREVVIGKQRFIVRKPAVKINADNVYVLQLLDILKDFDKYSEESYESAGEKVREFLKSHGIRKEDIDRYLRKYPASVFRYYYELEMKNVFT